MPKKRPGYGWRARLLSLLPFLLFAVGGYVFYLDGVVRVKFEGKRWALPARVFARSLELYPGAPLAATQLEAELERLGYRKLAAPGPQGSYVRRGKLIYLNTREFDFWDGVERAQSLRLMFDGGQLAALSEVDSGREVPLARLDPPLIGSIYPAQAEDRLLVSRDQLPELLVNALIAVEDRGFYRHFGINPLAIARAFLANIRAGGLVQGGSTLTQQLVKNFYLSAERSWGRKLREALMALLLERRYEKDEILEAYVNEIYLGQDGARAIHGFGLASHFYFGRSLDQLSIQQVALLVGLIKGPSFYDPRRHPERAMQRRNLVLGILTEQGVIGEQAAKDAARSPLDVTAAAPSGTTAYPAFMDLVRRQLRRDYREDDLTSEGLRIFTTLDPWIQEQAEAVIRRELGALEKEHRLEAGTLQGAAVVSSTDQAEVLAIVGGRKSGAFGFNRALDAVRPVGSLVKPAVYLTALEMGRSYTLVSRIEDRPITLRGEDGELWTPQNFDGQAHGEVALHAALAKSYNLATVKLGTQVGLDRVIHTLRRLGVGRPIEPFPSLLLGSVSLSPVEVGQMYQTLASGGFASPLRTIREVLTVEGRPLQRYPLTLVQSFSAESVYLVNTALIEAVRAGTGRSMSAWLPRSLTVAGKTGTTNDLRDSWFAGFSQDKVAVVWIGRDDNGPTGLTGSTGALRVWGKLMNLLPLRPLDGLAPEGIEVVSIVPESGLRAGEGCTGAVQFPFIKGTAPRQVAPCAGGSRDSPGFIEGIKDVLRGWFE